VLVSGQVRRGKKLGQDWLSLMGDPIKALSQDAQGLKRLLPLLIAALQRNDVLVDKCLRTCLRRTHFREELGSGDYRQICRDVLSAFSSSNIRSIVLKGAARILSPADNLMHICVHSFYWGSRFSIVWVCDAYFIINHYQNLDWHLVLKWARRSHIETPLLTKLAYLAEELNAPVPSAFLDHLHSSAVRSTGFELHK
jgi:hypothetical protein